MSFASAISLIVTVILLYYLLSQVYTILFRITGLTREKAKFQSISLLTNAGYTTGESELIAGDDIRRKIAKSAMVSGYFFSVVIVSLVINLFLSIDLAHLDSFLVTFIAAFGGLFAFLVVLNLPPVMKWMDRKIESFTARIINNSAKDNFISVLDSYGEEEAVCKIFLNMVPEILKEKKLSESTLKSEYGVNVLMYERRGQTKYATADTIFTAHDILLAFGPLSHIRKVFLIHDAQKKDSGEVKVPAVTNTISILENYDYQVLAEIDLKVVPQLLQQKSLVESKIKDFFSINVMMVSRDSVPLKITKDTILTEGDKVLVFGPIDNINSLFFNKGFSIKDDE